MRRPVRPMSKDELTQFTRRESTLEQIAQAFHGEDLGSAFANWEHIVRLVFDETKRHRGRELTLEMLPALQRRYGDAVALRMLPEIEEIWGDDEARRIFGQYAPLSPSDRQKNVIDRAFKKRYLRMSKRNKARLIREKLEENKNLPQEMQRGIGGVNFQSLEAHLRGLLKGLGSDSDLRLVKR